MAPSLSLIFLDAKDWRRNTFCHVTPRMVILETEQGSKREKNPLVQVREYACATADMLFQDHLLQQTGIYQGKLNLVWAYGVVFTNITSQHLNSLSADGVIEAIFPSSLTICKDEMTESVSLEAFRNKNVVLFTIRFRLAISTSMWDIIRRHLFPEIAIPAKKSDSHLQKVMGILQELLARNVIAAADKSLVDNYGRRPLVLIPEAAQEWMGAGCVRRRG